MTRVSFIKTVAEVDVELEKCYKYRPRIARVGMYYPVEKRIIALHKQRERIIREETGMPTAVNVTFSAHYNRHGGGSYGYWYFQDRMPDLSKKIKRLAPDFQETDLNELKSGGSVLFDDSKVTLRNPADKIVAQYIIRKK